MEDVCIHESVGRQKYPSFSEKKLPVCQWEAASIQAPPCSRHEQPIAMEGDKTLPPILLVALTVIVRFPWGQDIQLLAPRLSCTTR